MIEEGETRLMVSIDDLREFRPELAKKYVFPSPPLIASVSSKNLVNTSQRSNKL